MRGQIIDDRIRIIIRDICPATDHLAHNLRPVICVSAMGDDILQAMATLAILQDQIFPLAIRQSGGGWCRSVVLAGGALQWPSNKE